MVSTHVDIDSAEWTPGAPFYGPAAIYQGHDIVQLKILSDRRNKGGGIAWLAKFSPPPGKLIKIVATALSDEHVFNLEGGRGTKTGSPARASGGYTLNPHRPAAQRLYRHRDAEPDHLHRRARRDRLDGGGRYRGRPRWRPMTGGPMPVLAFSRDRRAEAVVTGGLAEYNAQTLRASDTATLYVLMHDEDGAEPLSGLLGHTSSGLFFLDLFYLTEQLRGEGLGSRIIALAEARMIAIVPAHPQRSAARSAPAKHASGGCRDPERSTASAPEPPAPSMMIPFRMPDNCTASAAGQSDVFH